MAGVRAIRRVSVEFLRPGPSHNQLLSPYTQYLAVCNDAGAAVVTVPYEHRVFERRLKELRYETGDHGDRLDMLHEIGRDMGRMLEAVPGFTGALMNDAGPESALVHLRLTLSAAELALLPFELAEVPVGSAATAVSIQTRPPVTLTRRIRTVSSEGVVWPDRPRILFVSGDPRNVPFEEHREVLLKAIRPFQYPQRDDRSSSSGGRREQWGDLLTILVDPTLVELQRACEAAAYTHIHVLTHGDVDELTNESYGLVLRHENGSADVVSGERFVSAITRVGHRPAVVTIASCDSGNVGSVVIPGASFAHAVHQSGIPFVVGAQFPLSKEGSIPLAARLYEGLLWGEHPLYVLQQARAELHARYNTNWHDWASVVVYEALPLTLDEQLDRVCYAQSRRALNAALEWIDKAVAADSVTTREALLQLDDAVEYAVGRLPLDGQYAVECIGLRASAHKRLAQAAFTLAGHTRFVTGDPFASPYDLLDRAQLDYARAARGLIVNDVRAIQRKATLHWVLVQVVSLKAALGTAIGTGEWEAARLAAEHYLDHGEQEERAWAHGSLAELWLVRLAQPGLSDEERAVSGARARQHVEELNRCYPGVDEFPIKSTRRQFERYIDWWGTERFAVDLGAAAQQMRTGWAGAGGVVETARQLRDLLQRRPAVQAARQDAPIPAAAPPAPDASSARRAASPDASSTGRAASPDAVVEPAAREAGGTLSTRAITAPPAHDGPFFTIDALPAGHGDCLWIEYGDGRTMHRVLIDCGTQATSKPLLARIDTLPGAERFLELFVLSHVDADHIGGALPLFRAVKQGLRFGDVWFNGWRHVSGQLGARQGEMFSTAIQDFSLPWNVWRDGGTIQTDPGDDLPQHVLPGGMTLTLLSPTRVQLDKLKPVWTRELKRHGLEPGGRVDYSRFLRGTPTTVADAAALTDIAALADSPFSGDSAAPNGSSIALLAEFGGASALLAADAHAPVLVDSIRRLLKQRGRERLELGAFKVSHHGSQSNVSAELLGLLDCSRYLISTNGDYFYHPDREAIARILQYGGARKTILFNYRSRFNDVWAAAELEAVRARYGCSMMFPSPDQPGIRVSLL